MVSQVERMEILSIWTFGSLFIMLIQAMIRFRDSRTQAVCIDRFGPQ